ncbi:WD40 repeat-containing protein [Cavenderia fasciculata]|uniref:WD40 repeat-containing protein n=1 Tax=Cavenderia fasciculata TaxID=261658 RepID=F4QB44_CACFS|nr:WD40 repeat-containing protein [Cavenderia fasciculata]EGG14816.1 WD40 repeat-containing protein [Cavenderia fasciculata]|eukprot:XP_004351332.1 WD40 repeat-containing protein [Cavenderia fasciculata]
MAVSTTTTTNEAVPQWNSIDFSSGGSIVNVSPIFIDNTLNKVIIFNNTENIKRAEIAMESFITCMHTPTKQLKADRNMIVVSMMGSVSVIELDATLSNIVKSKAVKIADMITNMATDPSNPTILYITTPSGVLRRNISDIIDSLDNQTPSTSTSTPTKQQQQQQHPQQPLYQIRISNLSINTPDDVITQFLGQPQQQTKKGQKQQQELLLYKVYHDTTTSAIVTVKDEKQVQTIIALKNGQHVGNKKVSIERVESQVAAASTHATDSLITGTFLRGIGVSSDGQYVAAYSTSKAYVCHVPTKAVRRIASEHQLTTLEFSPESGSTSLSYGTMKGRIYTVNVSSLFEQNNQNQNNQNKNNKNNKKQGDKETMTTGNFDRSYLHWHPGPVTAIAYSGDGKLLVSGGFEQAIVIWKLSLGQRVVVPRLGGTVRSLSIQGNLVAVALSTNAIVFIDVLERTAHHRITGIRYGENNPIESLHADALTDSLVFNGQDGYVQFYNFQHSAIRQLTVAPPLNTVIPTTIRGSKTPANSPNGVTLDIHVNEPKVALVALHAAEKIMATYEYVPTNTKTSSSNVGHHDDTFADKIVKFWDRSKKQPTLAYSIALPHKDIVTAMQFHPTLPILATGSVTDFKLWKRVLVEGTPIWNCIFTGSQQALKCSAISFSLDGSTVAFATGHVVSLWSVCASPALVATISRTTLDPLASVHFLANPAHILLVYKTKGACVWDVTTNEEVLVIPSTPYACAVDAQRELVALAFSVEHGSSSHYSNGMDANAIVILNQAYELEHISFHPSRTTHLAFGKDHEHGHALLYYTIHHNFISALTTSPESISAANARLLEANNISMIRREESVNQRIDLFKQKSQPGTEDGGDKKNKRSTTSATSTANIKDSILEELQEIDQNTLSVTNQSSSDLFNSASHIIPGVQSIYQSFMDSMLITKNSQADQKDQDIEMKDGGEKKNKKSILRNKNKKSANVNSATNTTVSTAVVVEETPAQPKVNKNFNRNYKSASTSTTTTTTTASTLPTTPSQPLTPSKKEKKGKFSKLKNFFDNDNEIITEDNKRKRITDSNNNNNETENNQTEEKVQEPIKKSSKKENTPEPSPNVQTPSKKATPKKAAYKKINK